MASYTVGTISLNRVQITSEDCPYLITNAVYFRITLNANAIVKLTSDTNYCIITAIFNPTTATRTLTILPAAGTTINNVGSLDLIYNGEAVVIYRQIGGSNFTTVGYRPGIAINTIGTSTNNAIVRVGASTGTVANSGTLIDDTGNLSTANNITALDIRNNGAYFYANTSQAVSLGTLLGNTGAAAIGINCIPVSQSAGIYVGYAVANPASTLVNLSISMIIGSQAVPNSNANTQNSLILGYNCWLPTATYSTAVAIGNNIFNSGASTPTRTSTYIGQNLFNDLTTNDSTVAIGRNFTTACTASVLIGSNIAPNLASGVNGFNIIGHNSVTNGTVTKSALTVIGTSCNVTLSTSVVVGYGINAQGPNTTLATIFGSTACNAATSLNSNSVNVIGYNSSPNVSGNDVVAIGSNTNGLGTTSIFAVGYQAMASATPTTSACLGFQSGQTGTYTNAAAIGYQALNAGASRAAVIGSKGFIQTTGQNNAGAGYNVGATLTTGTDNMLFGSGADVNAGARTQVIALGKGATAQGDGEFVLGSAGTALTTQTTIGAAGGASALPATPNTYLFVRLNGTLLRTPIYN